MKRKNRLLISLISLFSFVFLAGGISYGYIVYNKDIVQADLSTGSISIDFSNVSNQISSAINQPITDGLGKDMPYYLDFSVTGTVDTAPILYEIQIVPSSGNTLETQYVKIYLTDQSGNVLLSPFTYNELYASEKNNGKTLYQGLISPNVNGTSKTETSTYRLRVWIDENYRGVGANTFGYSVYLYAKNIDEEVSTDDIHRLSFDFGDERVMSKIVVEGEKYGALPSPVKEGYEFTGWNGKNLFDKDNYDNEHFILSSDGSISNEPGQNKLDDWASSDYMKVTPSTSYIKSGVIGGMTQDYFDSNKTFVSKDSVASGTSFTTASNCYYVKFNLNRSNSPYSDVQLEEGSTATPYEPYYVNNNLVVTERNGNYVLTAKYQEIEVPTLTLDKITYKNIAFDNTWTYHANASVNGDTLEFANDGTATPYNYATSDYIDVNNDFWYMTFDGYTNSKIGWTTEYYDNSNIAVNALDGNNSDSYSVTLTANTWSNDLIWNGTIAAFKNSNRYGEDVKKIKIIFGYNSSTSGSVLKIRDLKVYGQMSNSFYLINYTATDTEGISEIKYAKGNHDVSYFEKNGIKVNDDKIRVTENGVYTVYAKGVRGNKTVSTIEITNVA